MKNISNFINNYVKCLQALLAKITGKQTYKDGLTSYCDSLVSRQQTPKGLTFLDQWGSLRMISNAVYICLQVITHCYNEYSFILTCSNHVLQNSYTRIHTDKWLRMRIQDEQLHTCTSIRLKASEYPSKKYLYAGRRKCSLILYKRHYLLIYLLHGAGYSFKSW